MARQSKHVIVKGNRIIGPFRNKQLAAQFAREQNLTPATLVPIESPAQHLSGEPRDGCLTIEGEYKYLH